MALPVETKHVPTLVYAHYHAALLETIRLDPGRAKPHAEAGLALAREHRLELWTLILPPTVAWANGFEIETTRRVKAGWLGFLRK